MSNFTLKQEGYTSYTAIPNCFIEQFMPYAAGEFVKIYIYLLKCVSENRAELSISKIADVFNNTEKDVIRALKYWQKKGILKLTFDEENALTSLRLVSLTEMEEQAAKPQPEKVTVSIIDAPVPGTPGINTKHPRPPQPQPQIPVSMQLTADPLPESKQPASDGPPQPGVPEKVEYTADQIQGFSEQEDIGELFFVIAKYLGRPLTGQDANTVLYLYDSLQFPADLIVYLFEYCVSRDKKSIRYIEKTALGWAESGIRSVKAAKTLSGIYSDDCYRVLNAFGLTGRSPTKSESEFVSRWTLSYGFDMPIILKACNKTMDQIHQPSFEYADSILKSWKANGVSTLDDIVRLDEAFELSSRKKSSGSGGGAAKNSVAQNSRFNDFNQRTYDYQELEKKLRKKS